MVLYIVSLLGASKLMLVLLIGEEIKDLPYHL